MAFVDAFRRRRGLDAITGYNGGSLRDQLDEQPDIPPAQQVRQDLGGGSNYDPNRLEQTRPRSVFADRLSQMPQQVVDQPQTDTSATRPRSTNPFLERLMNDPSRRERPREVNPTDEVTKSADYVRQIQEKPLSLRDKAGLVAQNIATNLGGTPLATRRQRDIAKATGQLGQDLTVQGQQIKQQGILNQMDARDAAQRAAEERIAQGQSRLDLTALNQRRQRLVSQHSELKEFNPDDPKNAGFVAAWTKEFGYPPPKKTSGSLLQYSTGYDKDGNLVAQIIDKGTGEAAPVKGSQIATTEQGANREQSARQFTVAESGRNERARLGRAAAMQRTIVMAGAQGARMGDPNDYENLAKQADQDAADAAKQADDAGPRGAGPYLAEAGRARTRAVQLRELATKARGGQSPPGTAQPATTAPTRVFNDKAFRAAFQKKHNRQPTEAEIAPYRNAQP